MSRGHPHSDAPGRDDAARPRSGRDRSRLNGLEWLTLLHVASTVIAVTWAFGGQAAWVRTPLTAWASVGGLLTLAALLRKDSFGAPDWRALWWSVPVILFNGYTWLAAQNPSFTPIAFEGETLLAATGGRAGWPSSAQPALALRALWEFDALWLTGFNVAFILRRRRAVRALLLVVVVNAVALAIFGTAQKLLQAKGLFFGAVPSPQKYFFASFVYHNHWGAFVLLAIAIAIGLTPHYARRAARGFFHSPAFLGLIFVLLLAASVPLSASRSATILSVALLGVAFLHWVSQLMRSRRAHGESPWPPLGLAVAACAFAVGAIWHLGRDTIRMRFALTIEQVQAARVREAEDTRLQLYRDTWRMAQAKPWFGWGMASYPHVFTLFNTRVSVDRLPVFYHDAHSDWLQAPAEHGAVGCALLIAAALVPLVLVGRRIWSNTLSGYALTGCGFVVGYAALEFPFGNFAVVLTWWVCLFSAVRYAQLTAARQLIESRSPSRHD